MRLSRAPSKIFDGKKFMWDGREYVKENAEKMAEKYRGDGFEVKIIDEDNKYLLFTRRVVKEVKVEKA